MTNRTPWRRRALVGTTAGAVTGIALGVGLSLLGTAPARAATLPAFGDCDELLRWYVDRTLPYVGPYGIGGGPVVYGAMEDTTDGGWAASGSSDSAGSGSATSGSARVTAPQASGAEVGADKGETASGTGTNVQEAGVDEPDLAKTDGELVVRVLGSQLRVSRVGDASTGEVADVGALELPEDLQASELLLSGDRVLVVGASYGGGVKPMPAAGFVEDAVPMEGELVEQAPPPVDDDPVRPIPKPAPEPPLVRSLPVSPYWGNDSSRVVEVDLSDPASLRVLSDRTYGGSLVSARQYSVDGADGRSVVRLVLHTGMPTLDFVQPNRDRSEKEATEANKQIVRDSEISDWLPQVRDTEDPASSADPLLDCDEVRHPLASALPKVPGFSDGDGSSGDMGIMAWPQPDVGTLSIVTVPFSDPTRTDATAVTTSAQTVYSSTDRLYVALAAPDDKTQVHAFALDGDSTTYEASGTIPGMVRDRWSMDEQDGVLRVAVGYGGWNASDNGVVTLREDGGTLRQLGSVKGLGPNEEIKSVRWLGDLAIVVTFRQTDPLYTVDLSDPAAPRTLGALKVPGFSTYLHPLGADRLLGVGQDATLEGQVLGSQVSTFDISDLRDPRKLDRLPVDGKSLVAEYEPRALTWIPSAGGAGTVLTGTTSERDGSLGMVELKVRADGSLARGRTWSLSSWDYGFASPRALPLGDGRVALVGSRVAVIDVG